MEPWRPAEAGSGKRLPVSGSQLPSTGQTPPEDMKRKRRKMWSVCIFEMMYLNILSKSYLFLHIPGGIDLVKHFTFGQFMVSLWRPREVLALKSPCQRVDIRPLTGKCLG